MNLKNTTIRVRLSVTFGVLIAILALVSGMAVMNLYKDKEMFTNYVNGTYALQVQAYEVRHATDCGVDGTAVCHGEIKNLINASAERVDAGSKLVAEAGESMQVIVTRTQGVSQMIDELTLATNEQSQGISQVGIAIQQIDEVTQQNAALVVENAAAAESLHQQAGQLMQAMTQFRLEVGPA